MSSLVLHVNQNTIKQNLKHHKTDPPLIIRRSDRDTTYCNHATILVDGKKVGEFIYSPDKPLSCGARVYISLDPSLVQVIPTAPPIVTESLTSSPN